MMSDSGPLEVATATLSALRERLRRVGFFSDQAVVEVLLAMHRHAVDMDVRLSTLEDKDAKESDE
jgi:hypothetical protein